MIGRALGTTWTDAWLIVASTVGTFLAVIAYTRIAGLRSFSKMSSFDFAMTVAVGSTLATVAVASPSLLDGVVALGALYGTHVVIAFGRRRWRWHRLLDNQPILLMEDGRLIEQNLRVTRVTEGDIRAKLREANVLDLSAVRAVVLETTGDISVLHGDGPLDPSIVADVERGGAG